MEKTFRYFQVRSRFLDYPGRLRRGLSIGSGQVEGACKNMVGRRLKQTGARWNKTRLNNMLGVTSLIHTGQWDTFWQDKSVTWPNAEKIAGQCHR
ncbi:MAG: hypothetical protein PHQ75_11470 [Thermoguttaceae bacterium]|nr:hypothetical protein [Thermoguttaceae bacterium]